MQGLFGTGAARSARLWALGALLGLGLGLVGCGGGGDGDTGGNGTRPETLSLSVSELSATARVGEAGPVLTLTATVNDLGTEVYGSADPLTRNGLLTADLMASTGTPPPCRCTSRRPRP